MGGSVQDLVGAGDSFRAGVTAYISQNIESFKHSTISIEEAVQMGNLFASLYIQAPLNNRYGNVDTYANMLKKVKSQ